MIYLLYSYQSAVHSLRRNFSCAHHFLSFNLDKLKSTKWWSTIQKSDLHRYKNVSLFLSYIWFSIPFYSLTLYHFNHNDSLRCDFIRTRYEDSNISNITNKFVMIKSWKIFQMTSLIRINFSCTFCIGNGIKSVAHNTWRTSQTDKIL